MSKRVDKIKKLFRDTLLNGSFLEENKSSRDVVDFCEEQGKLFINKGLFIASVRSLHKGEDCIRMVFVVKESESGKVKDIDKIFELITELESTLICLDKCDQVKSEGFIYLDVIKKMISED